MFLEGFFRIVRMIVGNVFDENKKNFSHFLYRREHLFSHGIICESFVLSMNTGVGGVRGRGRKGEEIYKWFKKIGQVHFAHFGSIHRYEWVLK